MKFIAVMAFVGVVALGALALKVSPSTRVVSPAQADDGKVQPLPQMKHVGEGRCASDNMFGRRICGVNVYEWNGTTCFVYSGLGGISCVPTDAQQAPSAK